MANSKAEELKADLAELNKLFKLAERQKVKDIFVIETRKIETEIAKIQESFKKETSSNGEVPKKQIITQPQDRCYTIKLSNYAWDQSDKFVKIFVTIKNVHTIPEENVRCDFEATSVDMNVKSLENRNYSFLIKNLLENIDVSASKWKVKTDMVVIFLAKVGKNNWSCLTSLEKKGKETKPIPKIDPDEDPSTGLMSLLKHMYEGGDDEMKRTIAKSMTENSYAK